MSSPALRQMRTASSTITYSIVKSVRPLHLTVCLYDDKNTVQVAVDHRATDDLSICNPETPKDLKLMPAQSVQILTINEEETTTVDGNKRRKRIMITFRVSVIEKSGVAVVARRAECLPDRYLCCDRLSADNVVREMSLPDVF